MSERPSLDLAELPDGELIELLLDASHRRFTEWELEVLDSIATRQRRRLHPSERALCEVLVVRIGASLNQTTRRAS